MSQQTVECPHCGGENTEANFVDIGVGTVQATPYMCHDCHAVEMGPEMYRDEWGSEPLPELTEIEKRTGWYAPPPELTEIEKPNGAPAPQPERPKNDGS